MYIIGVITYGITPNQLLVLEATAAASPNGNVVQCGAEFPLQPSRSDHVQVVVWSIRAYPSDAPY
jgi:hypothetical protein